MLALGNLLLAAGMVRCGGAIRISECLDYSIRPPSPRSINQTTTQSTITQVGLSLVRTRLWLHFALFSVHIVGYAISDTALASLISRYSSPDAQVNLKERRGWMGMDLVGGGGLGRWPLASQASRIINSTHHTTPIFHHHHHQKPKPGQEPRVEPRRAVLRPHHLPARGRDVV